MKNQTSKKTKPEFSDQVAKALEGMQFQVRCCGVQEQESEKESTVNQENRTSESGAAAPGGNTTERKSAAQKKKEYRKSQEEKGRKQKLVTTSTDRERRNVVAAFAEAVVAMDTRGAALTKTVAAIMDDDALLYFVEPICGDERLREAATEAVNNPELVTRGMRCSDGDFRPLIDALLANDKLRKLLSDTIAHRQADQLLDLLSSLLEDPPGVTNSHPNNTTHEAELTRARVNAVRAVVARPRIAAVAEKLAAMSDTVAENVYCLLGDEVLIIFAKGLYVNIAERKAIEKFVARRAAFDLGVRVLDTKSIKMRLVRFLLGESS